MARKLAGDPDMLQGSTARASSRCEPLLFGDRELEAGWGGSGPSIEFPGTVAPLGLCWRWGTATGDQVSQ